MIRRTRLGSDESGQGLVEYALIIAIVSLGALVALGFLSGKINTLFSKTGNSVNNVTVAAGGGGSPPPPPAGVPLPGSVSVSCTGICDESQGSVINASTTGWDPNGSPITSYTFQWQDGSDNSNSCVGITFSNFGSATSGASTTAQLNPPPVGTDQCYRVVVTATNGVGTSAPITSSGVLVDN